MKTVEFNPRRFSWKALVMILGAAERWGCTPHEAATRLLDQVAQKELGAAQETAAVAG